MKRVLTFAAKAIVTAVLLYLVAKKADLTVVWSTIRRADLLWIAAVVPIFIIQVLLGALRWREIASACGLKLSAPTAVRYTFVGTFFNQLLPSTVGGDAARIWYLGRRDGEWASGTYSVFIDRVVGMLVLTLLLLLLMPWTFARMPDPAARVALVVVGVVSLAGLTGYLALSLMPSGLAEKFWIARHFRQAAMINCRLLAAAHPGLLVLAQTAAMVFLSVLAWWSSAEAISSPLSFVDAFLLVPPITLVATVPVSIAGWGVREGVVVASFISVGLPANDGLAISLIFGLAGVVVGALGGIVWLIRSDRAAAHKPG